MQKPIITTAVVALAVGIAIGWLIHGSMRPPEAAVLPAAPASPAAPAPSTAPALPDAFAALAAVPSTSRDYASAQRRLGWNYYAQNKHDLVEAKKHVDLALAASPDDPKVLEDAGRVYILAGYTDQGTAMLKKAGTPAALEFLDRH
jgi:hypothetical protein